MTDMYFQPTQAASTSSLPPLYSPSTASPPYTCQPSEEECRLDYVARLAATRAPDGVFTKHTRRISVILKNQEDGLDAPVYARHGLVSGEIHIDDKNVLTVSVELEGRQTMSIAELGPTTHVLFSQRHVLWKRTEQEECPRTVDFDIPFPLTHESKGSERPLPPSFEMHFTDVPGLHAEITYTLTVKISKPRLGSWKQHKSVIVPIKYQPRSRPYLPISPDLYPFLSTIKTAPEEWHQVTSVVPSADDRIESVDCHLFIPSVQIYGLTDIIPFHLQFRGSSKSLSSLLGLYTPPALSPLTKSTSKQRRTPSHPASPIHPSLALYTSYQPISEPLTAPKTKVPDHAALYALRNPYALLGGSTDDLTSLRMTRTRDKENFTMRVYLLRQVSTKVRGQRAWRNKVLAEGTLRAIGAPPTFSERPDSEVCALDWEGELQCSEDVSVASFAAGELNVKDYIVVQVCPPRSETPVFSNHQFSHPIRLTTDTYRDAPEHPASR